MRPFASRIGVFTGREQSPKEESTEVPSKQEGGGPLQQSSQTLLGFILYLRKVRIVKRTQKLEWDSALEGVCNPFKDEIPS